MVAISEIQDKIIRDLQKNFSVAYNKEFTFHNVFLNYRKNKGLRVNKDIFTLISKLYRYYLLNIKTKITSKHIIFLDNFLTMPWYLDYYKSVLQSDQMQNKLYLFAEKDTFILKLYDCDLDLINNTCMYHEYIV